MKTSDRRHTIILTFLFVTGTIYLLSGITHEGLWVDEIFTASIVKHSLTDIWEIIASYDTHPPLYYLLLRIHVLIFGHSVFALRLFSVLGVLALALLGVGPMRRACGIRTGIAYVFIIFITPITLVYAQEARMYTWAAFFVSGCLLYAYLVATQADKRDWLKLGIFSLSAAYTHYYALLAAVITHVLLLLWLLFKRKQLYISLSTTGVMVLCFTPWIMNVFHQTGYVVHSDFWIPEVTPATLLNTFLYPYSYQFLIPGRPLYSNIAYSIFVMLVLFGIYRSLANKRRDVHCVILSLSVFLLTILAGAVISFAIRPVLVPRFMVPVLGLFLLPVAYGLSQVTRRMALVSVCAILIGLSIPQILQIKTQEFKGPMNEVVPAVKAKMLPDDVFLHTNIVTSTTFAYYFPEQKHFLYAPRESHNQVHHAYTNIIKGPDLNHFLEKQKNVWLVGWSLSKENALNNYWVESGQLKTAGTIMEFHAPLSWFDVEVRRVTSPYPDGTYKLSSEVDETMVSSVTRAEMAISIIRAKFGEDFSYYPNPHFTDVPADHPAFKYIQKMYDEGITKGYAGRMFKPAENVSRAQMAVFVVKILFGNSCTHTRIPYFTDVPNYHWAFRYIQKIHDEGIISGYPDGTYRPRQHMSRAQMATVIEKAFSGKKK